MSTVRHNSFRGFRLVVAVASAGGLVAVSKLLEGLPSGFEVPLLLVQHRTPNYPDHQHIAILQRHSALPVRVAQPGAAVQTGVTLLASGALVAVDENLRYQYADAPTATIRSRRGDALFTSAASALGPAVIGLVLSGNLADGTQGARAIKRAGGRVLAQDPLSAKAPSMPTSVTPPDASTTSCPYPVWLPPWWPSPWPSEPPNSSLYRPPPGPP